MGVEGTWETLDAGMGNEKANDNLSSAKTLNCNAFLLVLLLLFWFQVIYVICSVHVMEPKYGNLLTTL